MKPFILPSLPVTEVFPQMKSQLQHNNQLILTAPPGAGKTTLVPLSLLDEEWNKGKKILVLEPRRLAARTAADRMAQILEEKIGHTVGYRIRLEKKTGPETRIEVVTEGILTRFLQNNPFLEDIGTLIFDEFHERSLHADLGLSFGLEVQETIRKDLRIIIMSATLHCEEILQIMPKADVISSEGKCYPVKTVFFENPGIRLERHVARAVIKGLNNEEGSILVFLPGAFEIKQVKTFLEELLPGSIRDSIMITPLYSALPWKDQLKAIRPSPPGVRKIVLATSIAETSLTIEGIRIVIDSGVMRVPFFNPGSGMNNLKTLTVTKDTADQRRGRAGRLEPGICYRLWNKGTDRNLVVHRTPEIMQVDLTSFVLELAAWGKTSPGELLFINQPSPGSLAYCLEVLQSLDGLDKDGKITKKGRQLMELPLHPRLAHMVIEYKEKNTSFTACVLASLLNEGDFIKDDSPDILLRLKILNSCIKGHTIHQHNFSQNMCQRIIKGAGDLALRIRIPFNGTEIMNYDRIGELLASAYPDRVGRRITPGIYQLVNGKQIRLQEKFFADIPEYIIAAVTGGQNNTIFLAALYTYETLQSQFSHHIREDITLAYLPEKKQVTELKRFFLGRLLLKDFSIPVSEPDKKVKALLRYIQDHGLDILPWDKKCNSFLNRILFAHTLDADAWPSKDSLFNIIDAWLSPWLMEGTLNIDPDKALKNFFTWDKQKLLDYLAPSHYTVPTGTRVPLDYRQPETPILAVRIQEIFGLSEHPVIGGGKIPLVLHLLSPANRPVQITTDLAGFWKNTYKQVKKDLKGRYPKHYWPDDPLKAVATKTTKKWI